MRERQHRQYYAIRAYQILAKMSDKQVADELGICTRTYKDKIAEFSDFTAEQGYKLSKLFGVTQDELFLT